MALDIDDPEVGRLARELAKLIGVSVTEAVRRALVEQKRRLERDGARGRRERWLRFLEHEVWPTIPEEELGRRLTREEEDALLGYGPEGI